MVGMRDEGEVGVQREALDFRGSLHRGNLFTDSYLGMNPLLVGILIEESQRISEEQLPVIFSLPTSPRLNIVG